ncbi:hypothetical protein ACFSMW_08115 [Virgibacillus halophilus]
MVKSVSGEGGLVGKAADASGRVLKGTAKKANEVIGKTSEAPGKFYRNAKGHFKHKNSQDDTDQKN